MSGFTVKLEGFEKAMSTLKNLPKEKLEQIDAEVEGTLYDIQAKAKQRVPKNAGGAGLAGSITVKKTGNMQGEVVVQKFYAAFVNFGTGQFAASYLGTVDKEWQAYAQQFYVNGKGKMPAVPYFTSAVDEERIALIKRVKEILLNK